MNLYRKLSALLLATVALISSCKSNDKKKEEPVAREPKLKEEVITYRVDSLTMVSYLVYDKNIEGKRPGVLVIHEWWGLNDYVKMRVRKLAELGYVAIAVDMYGDHQMADNPEAAQKLSTPFYKDPSLAKKRFDAALENFKNSPFVDTTKMAVMGYCFGGGVSIGMARMGENLKGAVSFHGSLNVVPLNKDLLKADILVCHGAADPFVPQAEVDQFKKQMDSIGAKYTFKSYDSALHAFTNPEATAIGKKFNLPIAYNAKADTASWNDMKEFFKRIFQ